MVTETKEEIVDLELTSIAPLQTRSCLRQDAVRELMFAVEQRTSIDPAIVIRDAHSNPPRCWMADGHHRLEAYRQLGRPIMPCRVRAGTKWDAIRIGLEANRKHVGERMTRADKEHAVRVVLKERPALADGAIAGLVGCDPKTVAKYRSEMIAGQEIPTCDAREGVDGKVYQIAPRRQVTANDSQSSTAELDAPPHELDACASDTPFEPTSTGPREASNNGERSNVDQTANGEGNDLQPAPQFVRRLPAESVIASGSDSDGGGQAVKSRNPSDFEKSRSDALKHVGLMKKSVDNMKAISPNDSIYRDFEPCADRISQLLQIWPQTLATTTDDTGPRALRTSKSVIDNF